MSTLRGMVLLATFPFVALSEEAKWIGVPDVLDPAVAKTFCVSAGLTSAVLKVTGVGYYEARINGRKVGRKVPWISALAPRRRSQGRPGALLRRA